MACQRPPGKDPQAKVTGIPGGIPPGTLQIHFGAKAAKLMPLKDGQTAHVGYVNFDTEADVERAVRLFDGKGLNGRILKVSYV